MSFLPNVYTFNDNIPFESNDPSADQPDMLNNNKSSNLIMGADHVTYNTEFGGTHLQTTYITNNVPGNPSGTQSVAYTNVGQADTASQYFFKNPSALYMLNAVKAFGNFTLIPVPGPVTANNIFNVAAISKIAATTYTITLTANATKSDHPIFIPFANTQAVLTTPPVALAPGFLFYTYTKPTFTVFGVSNVGGALGGDFNFIVLEA